MIGPQTELLIRVADWLLAANMMWRGCEFAAMILAHGGLTWRG